MALLCPECERAGLKVVASLELGSDARSDETALQVVECPNCGFQGAAVYEESRRGVLDDESVIHTAWQGTEAATNAIRRLIASCTDPKLPSCPCRGHQVGRTIAQGKDVPELAGIDWDHPRPIRFVSDR